MTYDTIVIGGGPSGLMAAAAAAGHGAKTLLVDKGDKLGRKLGISGGGRCNVTNNKEPDELIRHIPGNGRFLYSALHTFGTNDIVNYFEGLGIRLKEEDRGRMFPVSDKAKTVVDALIGQVRRLGVDIEVNAPVDRVLYSGGRVDGVRLRSGKVYRSRTVIIATGGKSVPHTGSTGDGYQWAMDAGHTITELYPTEVPITSGESFIRSRELQGLSLRDITLTVWKHGGKKIITHEGDLIFTHFGISGPAALRCSQFVVKDRQRNGGAPVSLTIDLFPSVREEELLQTTEAQLEKEAKKAVKNALRPLTPERLIPVLLKLAGVNPEVTYENLPKQALRDLARLMKAFPVEADGTLSIEEAFVTGGGVSIKEIDPKTMQSRLTEGLFFCGEVLDVHGYTGGYNITAAFSTGYTSGKSAAAFAAETEG